jgi:hypothetical protein
MRMSSSTLQAVNQAQRDRLAFVELRLQFLGDIRRQDLMSRFDIQAAAATRDIGLYKELASNNLDYDPKNKIYVRGSWFRPIFEFSGERVLTWMFQGFGDSEPQRVKPLAPFANAALLARFDLEILSMITRAIYRSSALEITYRALSSGLTHREIVPFALANNGQRWHVRAYDRRSNEFRDFVLGRIAEANMTSAEIGEHERAAQDIQWNRITELELVPHPANVQHPDTIEAEYGMVAGVLNLQVRAAMAGYLLRYWNVDCTEDHRLKGAEYHLWLRNRQALYGVSNLVIAPGYEIQGGAA